MLGSSRRNRIPLRKTPSGSGRHYVEQLKVDPLGLSTPVPQAPSQIPLTAAELVARALATQTIKSQLRNMANPAPIVHMKIDFKEKNRFAGTHFDVWAMRVKTILKENDLWAVVDGTSPRPAQGAAADVVAA